MSIQIGEPPATVAARGFALFALGFRPFFLFAGFSAILLMGLWLLVWQGRLNVSGYFDVMQWHAHEMLFGYVVSVIAGFLLTAVRNWTGMAVPIKGRLAGLALIWLLARILLLTPGTPPMLVALVDLMFIPLLGFSLFKPLWFGQNKVNRYFLLLFGSMTLANRLADKLNRDAANVNVLIPLGGWSEADREGGPLYAPDISRAFIDGLKALLDPGIPVNVVEHHINDDAFARIAVDLMIRMVEGRR